MSTEKEENIKNRLAERAIMRASSGLMFLNDCLRHRQGGTDAAYSRSWYILLSFNFELILKARLILASNFAKKQDIMREIKSHNLENLSKKISASVLSDLGINSIKRIQNNGFLEYVVKVIDNKRIIIQDLTDVRYDFEKKYLRIPDPNEVQRIKDEIVLLQGMVKKVQDMTPLFSAKKIVI